MTKIIFRRDIESGEIIAFFKGMLENNFLTCYVKIGQHGDASYDYYINDTVPAKKSEYLELLEELKQIGYPDIKIYKRGVKW